MTIGFTDMCTSEVSARPLGNQDDFLPCALLGQRLIVELCLHYGDNIMPVGGVRYVVPRGINQPLAEVFHSHYLGAS